MTPALAADRAAGPLTLSTFQSLWAMEDLPHRGDQPWSLGEQVDRIAGAGFDGLAVDLGARQAPRADAIGPLARDAGLRTAVFAFLDGALTGSTSLANALTYAVAIDARDLVVCGQVFDPDPARLAAVVHDWFARAADAGVRLQLETHRNTMTNDIRATIRLLDVLDPAVTIAVDLSHHVCGCELPDGHHPETEALVDRILDRAGSLQGRIATRGQVQVPIDYPVHAAAVDRFRDWWTRGFASIRRRRAAGEDLPDDVIFCCELGTTPYAITGPDGHQLSDRWAEALTLRDWARHAFAASAAHPAADPLSDTADRPAPVEIAS